MPTAQMNGVLLPLMSGFFDQQIETAATERESG